MTDHRPEFGELSSDDQRVLDALMEAGLDPAAVSRLPENDRERGRRLLRLIGLLEDYPVDDADASLVDATIARVRRKTEVLARIERDDEVRQAGGFGLLKFRLPDLLSMAAVLLIVASIMLPVMQQIRQRSVAQACANNMVALGSAFSSFAAANENRVPAQVAGFAGSTPVGWLDPLPLVRQGYCDKGHASCPAHGSLHLGYSYQVQAIPMDGRLAWRSDPSSAVLGDRNPVLDARRAANLLSPLTNSTNHSERGQNLLLHDLSVVWLEVPVRGSDDNIWLPLGANESDPVSTPATPLDTFLAH